MSNIGKHKNNAFDGLFLTRLVFCTAADKKPRKTQNNRKIMERYRILANGKLIATTRDGARAFALAYDCLLTARTLCPNKRPPRIHVTDYKWNILREF